MISVLERDQHKACLAGDFGQKCLENYSPQNGEGCPGSEDPLKCPVLLIQKVLGGKWKIVILFKLKNGTMRFNELYKAIPGISQAILTNQLRDLEKDGVIKRKVYPVIPPKVEYTLSEIGQKLLPALEGLFLWGISYIESENPSS